MMRGSQHPGCTLLGDPPLCPLHDEIRGAGAGCRQGPSEGSRASRRAGGTPWVGVRPGPAASSSRQ